MLSLQAEHVGTHIGEVLLWPPASSHFTRTRMHLQPRICSCYGDTLVLPPVIYRIINEERCDTEVAINQLSAVRTCS